MVVTPAPEVLRRRDDDGPTGRPADRRAHRLPVDGISVDPACAAAVGTTVRTLESAGHHVVDAPLPLPPADELIAALMTIWNLGGAGIPLADPDRVEPRNRALRDAARAVDSWTYAEAVKKAQQLSRPIVEAFVTSYDLFVTPTMACLPPPVGALGAGTGDAPLMALRSSYPMTCSRRCST